MNDASSNDYFQRKQVREAAIQQAVRRRQMRRMGKWFLGVVIVVGLGYWLFAALNGPVGPAAGEFFKAQSRDHIAIGAPHAAYNSNPPTSGWHYDTPVQTGIYDAAFPDEQLIHNLEHGHIWIAYRPDLPKEDIEKLANIAKSYGSKIVMTSRPNNPTPIAIVAWEYLLKLDHFNEQQIKDFIDDHRGKGPEVVSDFGFKDFRGQPTPTPGAPMN